MTTARITQADRKTTQSGKAQAGKWLLEFERVERQLPDPLTGWAGSGDTKTQIRIWFDSPDQAIAYAIGADAELISGRPGGARERSP